MKPHTILVFPSRMGWMAVVAVGTTVKRLAFGHPTAAAAEAAVSKCGDAGSTAVPVILSSRRLTAGRGANPLETLARRLRAYAAGKPDDFRDIRVDLGPLSNFQRRVLAQCRRIAPGSTISYAELATKAGHPGAARAVGNCMAANRIPLIIPCHRVVCSNGRLGAYSAPGGARTKRRLLTLESHN